MAVTPRTAMPKRNAKVRYVVQRPARTVFPNDPRMELAMRAIYTRRKGD